MKQREIVSWKGQQLQLHSLEARVHKTSIIPKNNGGNGCSSSLPGRITCTNAAHIMGSIQLLFVALTEGCTDEEAPHGRK